MEAEAQPKRRLPRFRRALDPPPFRLTEDDIRIVRLVAQHRFLQSTHIAALVGRSLDRTNDRLRLLFHSGYLDRPRAQLDRFPTAGSAPMVYALADRGASLLAHSNEPAARSPGSRRNREAGRPFIEHQLGIMDFQVALRLGAQREPDVELIEADELIAAFPKRPSDRGHPFALHARLPRGNMMHDVAVVPDLAFGLRFRDGSRRCFMAEIDRGTMPIQRTDFRQTSIERKVHAYLAAYAERQHERRFGWKTFRVLTVTSNRDRMAGMMRAVRDTGIPGSLGKALFLFAERNAILSTDSLHCAWTSAEGRQVSLVRHGSVSEQKRAPALSLDEHS